MNKIFIKLISKMTVSGVLSPERLSMSRTAVAFEQWVADKHYLDCDINMFGAANQMGVTYEELSFYFRRRFKMGFLSWRKYMRIQDAKSIMLTDSDILISDVSMLVGIKCLSNFKKQFEEVEGVSLAQWRSKHCN